MNLLYQKKRMEVFPGKRIMKSCFFFVTLLALITVPVFAQYGVKLGVNESSLFNNDEYLNYGINQGLNGGFFINLHKNLLLEAIYVQKGAKYFSSGKECRIVLQYVDIPLLLKIKLPIPYLAPNIHIGPYAGIPIRADYEKVINGKKVKREFTGLTKEADWGYMLGFGFDIGPSPGKVTFDARYSHSLMTIVDDKDDVLGETMIKNGTILFMLGWVF